MCNHHLDPAEQGDLSAAESTSTSSAEPGASDSVTGSKEDSFDVPNSLADEDNKYLARETHTPSRSSTSGFTTPLPVLNKTPALFDSAAESLRVLDASAGIMEEPEEDKSAKPNFAPTDEVTQELQELYTNFQKCLDLRDKYMKVSYQRVGDNPSDQEDWVIYPPPPPPSWPAPQNPGRVPSGPASVGSDFVREEVPIPGPCEYLFELDSTGVYQVYTSQEDKGERRPIIKVPTPKEYFLDLDFVLSVISDGPTKSFAFRRLKYLESKWNMYILLNEYEELTETKRVPHRDFYNVRKVDTHVHHSSCMNQKHLLQFIKSKLRGSPKDVVIFRDDKDLTLEQVFQSLHLTAYDLSIDTLDMHAHKDSFHRFDKFNLKYNPVGESRLREIFLKTDNKIKGHYLADLTKEVISDLEQSKYQMAEYRISIYGRSEGEWDKLADWVIDNKLFSPNVRWLIQIPRLYNVYKSSKTVESFEKVLINIFKPLFEVSIDPSSHPNLHIFLQRVVGFDSVDDESKAERRTYKKYPYPRAWTISLNPPYSYYIYYLFANMTSLNALRQRRKFNTFVLRPHCGEAGDTDHLTSAFLTSFGISHGILLRKVPALQYLYYLTQMGIAMSPLSNNALFLDYERNPFPVFFHRGLNVSLSTDDPLQFHFTKEPLIEEYSVAAQIWKLSAADMCEISRNSVSQSGFENQVKKHFIGRRWYLPGVQGNDMAKTNVPNIRVNFRYETLREELSMLHRYSQLVRSSARSYTTLQNDLKRRMTSGASSPTSFKFMSANASPSGRVLKEGQESEMKWGRGLVDVGELELLHVPPLPKAMVETVTATPTTPASSQDSNGHMTFTDAMTIERQYGTLPVVAGVCEMAERAAAKKREKLRQGSEKAGEER
ncbi:AMP deaminase [Lunasporangiospora selenospora]|uniref:AMP deaminase n=1 Tax=Lunasporangiospora selenospora TaxID=979761 RepID=A0A9P6G2Y0_9FUNG|nr:AMP deaminase [Lunasporangiospora selenospora]